MREFVFEARPARVLFGAGRIDALADEVERLEAKRALVLSTPEQREQAEDAAHRLGGAAAGIFDQAVMHVPIETAEAARAEAKRVNADCCVAIGGGSTTGLAKAIALDSGLPILAIPTTFAGSEMTPIWGLTEGGVKTTGRDARVLPKTVIYDPELTLTLPPAVAGASGINAMAHSVEALYAENANPIASLMAEESLRALAASLPKIVAQPADLEARSEALYGAWLAGIVLGSVGMALHHKLCHTLGGSFGLPHAETHTLILPHAAAYNAAAAPEAMASVARAFGAKSAPGGLFDLARAVGAKMALSDFGMREADLDRAADIALSNPYYNPRPVEKTAIRAQLDDAYHGRAPGV
ncbi:MAG: maleylacetate reductase [Alphaproteobacteria bacterium]